MKKGTRIVTKIVTKQVFLFSNIILMSLLHSQEVFAEVTNDRTLGVERTSIIDTQIKGRSAKEVRGGARRGRALFHSFRDFNIKEEQSLYFRNPSGVRNIFSRVTGGRKSFIEGRLGVLGPANLYILNPNGIIFGTNSSLDLSGSFLATTASSFIFEENFSFDTIDPKAPPLLTIKVPIGIQFQDKPASIHVHSQYQPDDQAIGLNLKDNQSIGLFGGSLLLDQGVITAPDGQVELGSLSSSGQILFQQNQSNFATRYSQGAEFGDITISNLSSINTSGMEGGGIKIRAGSLKIAGGSQLNTNTSGTQTGNGINLNISETLEVVGTTDQPGVFDPRSIAAGILIPLQSAVITSTSNSAFAGDINVKAKKLIIKDGGLMISESRGDGRSGDINLLVQDTIEVEGLAPYPEQVLPSGAGVPGFSPEFSIEANATSKIAVVGLTGGDGGAININTKQLEISNGGVVSSTPLGQGNGGEINIDSENIVINGTTPSRAVGSQVVSTNLGSGTAGDINLNTTNLEIGDGANISSGAIGVGDGGNINIYAKNEIKLLQSAIVDGNLTNNTITADAIGTGKAGNISIRSNNLQIKNLGGVSINSMSSTAPGNLSIESNSIALNNANVSAQSSSGSGGDIQIQFKDLFLLQKNSKISSTAGTPDLPGDGGNVVILGEGLLIALPDSNSDIQANSFNGQGGIINISVNQLSGLLLQEELTLGNDITAVSINRPELNGTVDLNIINEDTQSQVTRLPADVVDPSQLTQTSCIARDDTKNLGSKFILVDRRFPFDPNSYIQSGFTQPNWLSTVTANPTPNASSLQQERPLLSSTLDLQRSVQNSRCTE